MSRALRRELPAACEIWTALSVGREPLASRGGDRLLFDNGDGGSGRTLRLVAGRGPSRTCRARSSPAASGRTMRAAARRLGAYAIDVGSAVDARPGMKSPEKIAALFDALRPPSRERLRACA